MTFEELKKIYDKKKILFGRNAYKHIPEVLEEAKAQHKIDFKGKDHERSWRIFIGKNLARFIEYVIANKVKNIGLGIVSYNTLKCSEITTTNRKLGRVKRNLVIFYGKDYGAYMPDVDVIIFNPKDCEVVAVLSTKVTLRERNSLTDWEKRLAADECTEHIKVYFLSLYKNENQSKRAITKQCKTTTVNILEDNCIDTQLCSKVKKLDKLLLELQSILLAA